MQDSIVFTAACIADVRATIGYDGRRPMWSLIQRRQRKFFVTIRIIKVKLNLIEIRS